MVDGLNTVLFCFLAVLDPKVGYIIRNSISATRKTLFLSEEYLIISICLAFYWILYSIMYSAVTEIIAGQDTSQCVVVGQKIMSPDE